MAGVLFFRGQQLGRNDLNIFLENASGHPMQAAEIYYSLYDFTTGLECLVGEERRVPQMPSLGEYFACVIIPTDARIGSYRIRWFFREMVGAPLQSVVQEFQVIDKNQTAPSVFSDTMTDLIRRLRILLRDNDPDRNYRAAPPSRESTISQFNRVFGFLWEDYELDEYIQRSLDLIVASPPRTPFGSVDQMVAFKREWTTLLLTGAATFALRAMMLNWIQNEFSISGESKVRVRTPDGVEHTLTIEELYEVTHGQPSKT